MLNAMEPLVAYGLYWSPADVKSIIGVLVSLIDGNPEQFLCTRCVQLFVTFRFSFVLFMLLGNNEGRVKPKNENNRLLFELKTK